MCSSAVPGVAATAIKLRVCALAKSDGLNALGENADGLNTDGLNALGENADGLYASGLNALGENAEGLKALGENALGANSADRCVRFCVLVSDVYACEMSLNTARS